MIICATLLAGSYANLLGREHQFPLVMDVGPDNFYTRIPFTTLAMRVFVIFLFSGILVRFDSQGSRKPD